MATVASLKNRVQELERELNALTSKQDELRQRLEREYADRTAALERRLQETLAQERDRWNHEVARQARSIREELTADLQRQTEEIRRQDAEAQRQREQLVQELRTVNDELARQLQDLRKQDQERTEHGHAAAELMLRVAEDQKATVNELPHEFFCAGQFDVLAEHLEQARFFLDQGMNEAATSSADMCLAELEILEVTVREQQRIWEQLFDEYRRNVTAIYHLMEAFEQEPVSSPLAPGAFYLEDEDRDDWSRGVYPEVHDEVNQAYGLVRGAEAAGSVSAFLADTSLPHARELSRSILQLNRLSDRLTAAIVGIRNELAYSDHRELLAQAAAQALTSQGLHVTSEGYLDDDPLESYVMELTGNGLDVVRLSFVPVRRDGVVERTVCLVSLDLRTVRGGDQMHGLAETTVRVLQRAVGDGADVRWDGTAGRVMQVEEQRLKAVPDVRLLARRYERKYQ